MIAFPNMFFIFADNILIDLRKRKFILGIVNVGTSSAQENKPTLFPVVSVRVLAWGCCLFDCAGILRPTILEWLSPTLSL